MNNVEGLTNTPLINYFRYKQSTFVNEPITPNVCVPISDILNAGNGQLVVTTTDTSLLSVGVAITIASTTSYNGNYTVISTTPITFNISGEFVGNESGTWELASGVTGANAGDPLDFGVITFYDNDTQTVLQDTYQDRDLTVLNPNPITLDAVGSYPPIYMIDNPYYIVIRDKFNNLIATLENYLPTASNDIPDFEIGSENLFPSYGFETLVNTDLYEINSLPSSADIVFSGGWRWQIETTQVDPANTLDYEVVSDLGLDGNPKNKFILRSTNNAGGKTVNRIGVDIGEYNQFQGKQLIFAVYVEVISGSANNLDVEIQRTRNRIAETPINVGTIPISPALTQETLIFTVPFLTDANYVNNDTLLFWINLPLNEDFEYGITGTWLQLSDGSVPTVSEHAGSANASKLWLSSSLIQIKQEDQYNVNGLPLVLGGDRAELLNQTGSILTGPAIGGDDVFNYAQSMDSIGNDTAGIQLLRDNINGFSQTNRIIDFLREKDLVQSRHTFIIEDTTATYLDVATGIGTLAAGAWSSAFPARITVVKTRNELLTGLKALPLGNDWLEFEFVQDFNATVTKANVQYSGGGGNLWFPGSLQTLPVMPNFGSFDFREDNTSENIINGWPNFVILSNGGGGTPAKIRFRMQAEQRVLFPIDKRQFPVSLVGIGPPGSYNCLFRTESFYQPHLESSNENPLGLFRAWRDAGIQHQVANIPWGYFAFNDIGNNPNPQPYPPPHLIKFSIDGNPSTTLAGTLTTTIVPINSGMTPAQVCAQVEKWLNNAFSFRITFLSLPDNGDYIIIANDITVFNVIFWDTAMARPSNPSSNVPVYVQFTTSNTIADLVVLTATAIQQAVIGIPRAASLGFTFPHMDDVGTSTSGLLKFHMCN